MDGHDEASNRGAEEVMGWLGSPGVGAHGGVRPLVQAVLSEGDRADEGSQGQSGKEVLSGSLGGVLKRLHVITEKDPIDAELHFFHGC